MLGFDQESPRGRVIGAGDRARFAHHGVHRPVVRATDREVAAIERQRRDGWRCDPMSIGFGVGLQFGDQTVASPPVTPLSFPNLAWWFDISNASSVTHTGGTFVSAADLSGNGLTLSAMGSPTYSTTAFNSSFPGIATDGSTSWCRTGLFATALAQPSTQYYTLYIPGRSGLYATGGTLSNRNALLVDSVVSGAWQFYAGSDVTDIHSATANDAYSPHLLCVVVNGASTTIYIDHWNTFDASARGNAGPLSLTELTIGGLDNSGALFAGAGVVLGETFAYSVAHSSATRQALMTYWGGGASPKWGIAASA